MPKFVIILTYQLSYSVVYWPHWKLSVVANQNMVHVYVKCLLIHTCTTLYSGHPSIMNTIGTSKLVILIEVSFVEGSFNIIKYQMRLVWCPLFRGVYYKGVTQTYTVHVHVCVYCIYSKTSDSGPSEIGTQYNKPLNKGRFSMPQIIGLPIVLMHFEPPRRGQPLYKGQNTLIYIGPKVSFVRRFGCIQNKSYDLYSTRSAWENTHRIYLTCTNAPALDPCHISQLIPLNNKYYYYM